MCHLHSIIQQKHLSRYSMTDTVLSSADTGMNMTETIPILIEPTFVYVMCACACVEAVGIEFNQLNK